MDVIGGCYSEVVREPAHRRLCGSGMRAAAILSALGHEAVLHTRVDDASTAEARAVAAGYNVNLDVQPRAAAIEFRYTTPLAIPSQSLAPSSTDEFDLERDHVVAFGMVEGPWRIRADKAVVDPQHSTIETSGLASSNISRLALILNAREATRLADTPDLAQGADRLLADSGAEVVIVKRGIRGASVVTVAGVTHIGAHPTVAVHPIGSGDAFTAGFAAAWIGEGLDPVAAATYASRVAAAYCTFGDVQITEAALSGLVAPLPDVEARIYLAGPFFTAAERWLIEQARDGLLGLGVEVFSPSHDIGFGGDEVAQQDLDGLATCTGVLALLDGGDPGTLFEIGWARHAGLPVVAYSATPDSPNWTMLRGSACEVSADLATAVYRAGWAAMRPRKETS